jgi:hypothetical protein
VIRGRRVARRLGRAIAGALFTVAALAPPALADARADGAQVILVAPGTGAFGGRVRAEIEAMGFSVEAADALPARAVAAARVIESPPPRRIELWIADPGSARLELRAVIIASAEEDEASQAFRASERLRAFFAMESAVMKIPK